MFIPHPGSEFFPSRIRMKEFKYFNPQKLFSKNSEIWSGLFISGIWVGDRGSGSKQLKTDPGVEKSDLDPGSAMNILYHISKSLETIFGDKNT